MEESVRWLICSHCPKKSKKPLDMVRHLRIHNSVKPYKCHVCQRSFRLKSTLMSHLNSHSGVKNFTCPICGKKLASRSSLALHQTSQWTAALHLPMVCQTIPSPQLFQSSRPISRTSTICSGQKCKQTLNSWKCCPTG